MDLPDFSANLSRPSLSGLNNRIWFFVDDFQSLYFYPDTPEAGPDAPHALGLLRTRGKRPGGRRAT
jgi:hypothetical protein